MLLVLIICINNEGGIVKVIVLLSDFRLCDVRIEIVKFVFFSSVGFEIL